MMFRYGKPSVLREIYRRLTGDMSASETSDQALVDAKIRLIIDLQDPSIVDDLRQHNPGRPPKYEKFWEECRKFLNHEVETAVDERRHGQLTHLAKAMSVQDMLQQVSQKCPPGVLIPSKQWLRLQFWPKNPTTKTALQFTGKLDVKFMVQARQLRKWHTDAHYCILCMFISILEIFRHQVQK